MINRFNFLNSYNIVVVKSGELVYNTTHTKFVRLEDDGDNCCFTSPNTIHMTEKLYKKLIAAL